MSALPDERVHRKPRSALLEPLDLPKAPPSDPDLPQDRFLNREVSWLEFNGRVLQLAEDPTTPLLERVKFLAIFAGNLDEFFMVRVAGLKRRAAARLGVRSADGLSVREQLEKISERTSELMERQARCFIDTVGPALTKQGIRVAHWDELDDDQHARLREYFSEQVFPVLTPLAVDPAHPFPYISGLSLNLAVMVRDPAEETEHFARIKVPPNVPRLVSVADEGSTATFVPLEELIGAHLPQLFPGLEVVDWHVFRVTRNQDIEVEEDEAEDLLRALERELARRRFGPAVRLEVEEDIDDKILDVLLRELEVDKRDVYRVPGGLLDLSTLWALYDIDQTELKDAAHVGVTHPRLAGGDGEPAPNFFSVLQECDVLLHHPYDSFATSVQRFIEQAAADPHVLAIKQTLYRTSGDSPIVEALIDAAEAGKQVVVLVEIKARFDESANIRWARALEQAGCHVVYGLIGLKTHCKAALVVRQERGQIRRYCHVGTGNYNPKTARLYEDVGLLTSDPQLGADLTDLFNVLTGYSRQTDYRTITTAPTRLRDTIIDRIENEARAAREGRPAGIRMKMNALVDEQVIDALYRASRDGVRIECLVRGICALRPGIKGLSETVTVRSILGRFLEHSRVFHFEAAGEWWMGSADMMHRNLDRRIETLIRVHGQDQHDELSAMLDLAFSPRISAWTLAADGTWHRHHRMPEGKDQPVGASDQDDPYTIDYQGELAALTFLRSDHS
ncbi:MAG TPA: RNA degradosome polyphosphate kinase [Frankiaceae bacterium]|nr:RNA degradosome polyphosphate kinase [Frankiaceae bacterium]